MLTAGAASSQAQDSLVYTVGQITLIQEQVFPLRDDSLPALAVLNRFHILTKPRIIRNELLFHSGEAYRDELVEETERNLRRMKFLGEVHIRRDTVADPDNSINLTVHTRDKWALEMGGGYKQEGGIVKARITLKSSNFLGNAQTVKLNMNWRTDRDNPRGLEWELYERRLLGSWWEGRIASKRADEQTKVAYHLRRRYYTEATTWATSLYTAHHKSHVYIYDDGERSHDFPLSGSEVSAWFSAANAGQRKWAVTTLLSQVRTKTDHLPPRPFDNLDLAGVAVSRLVRQFVKKTYLDDAGPVEDVPLGYQLQVMVGKNFYFDRPNTPNYVLGLNLHYTTYLSSGIYFGLTGSAVSYQVDGAHRDMTLYTEARLHRQLFSTQNLAVRIVTLQGHRWSPYRQVTLGTPSGLRGFAAYGLTGQRLTLFNIENRFFTPLRLGIFRLGGVLFFDAGTTWEESETFQEQRLHVSAGIGLRIKNDVQQGLGMTRIDFAFRPGRQGLAEIVISADQLFRSFLPLDLIVPEAILRPIAN